MLAYQPPRKSLWERASENLAIQLTVIFLILSGVIFFIMHNHKESIFSRMKFLRGSSPQVSRSVHQNQFLPESSSNEAENNEMAPTDSRALQADERPVAKSSQQDPKTKPETRISYLEIPTVLLSRWLEEGILTRVETFEGVTIAYIPQIEKVLQQSQGQIRIIKETSFPYVLNQLHSAQLEGRPLETGPTPARFLAQDAPESTTINTYATIDDEKEATIVGQMEVSTSPQSSIPAHFEMAPHVSFFMSGFSKSQNFERTPETELVVILQVRK